MNDRERDPNGIESEVSTAVAPAEAVAGDDADHQEDTVKKVKPKKAVAKKKKAVVKKMVKSAKATKKTVAKKRVKNAKANGTGKTGGKNSKPRAESGSKLKGIAALMTRKSGCTREDLLKFTGWSAISPKQQAESLKLRFRKEKVGRVMRYYAAAKAKAAKASAAA